ncbi:MAG: hypothetical protein OXU45_03335 [Candidatus Melainabacteria bacterium]|nr:hypothetical protein [Candidatus Melainabacteria bacterium]
MPQEATSLRFLPGSRRAHLPEQGSRDELYLNRLALKATIVPLAEKIAKFKNPHFHSLVSSLLTLSSLAAHSERATRFTEQVPIHIERIKVEFSILDAYSQDQKPDDFPSSEELEELRGFYQQLMVIVNQARSINLEDKQIRDKRSSLSFGRVSIHRPLQLSGRPSGAALAAPRPSKRRGKNSRSAKTSAVATDQSELAIKLQEYRTKLQDEIAVRDELILDAVLALIDLNADEDWDFSAIDQQIEAIDLSIAEINSDRQLSGRQELHLFKRYLKLQSETLKKLEGALRPIHINHKIEKAADRMSFAPAMNIYRTKLEAFRELLESEQGSFTNGHSEILCEALMMIAEQSKRASDLTSTLKKVHSLNPNNPDQKLAAEFWGVSIQIAEEQAHMHNQVQELDEFEASKPSLVQQIVVPLRRSLEARNQVAKQEQIGARLSKLVDYVKKVRDESQRLWNNVAKFLAQIGRRTEAAVGRRGQRQPKILQETLRTLDKVFQFEIPVYNNFIQYLELYARKLEGKSVAVEEIETRLDEVLERYDDYVESQPYLSLLRTERGDTNMRRAVRAMKEKMHASLA